MALARDARIRTATPTSLSISTLSMRDALLIVHPEKSLPIADLVAFLHQGGRLAIADDFGRGDDLLRAFGIERRAPSDVDSRRFLRGNRNVLVATGTNHHPLSQGADALVTNHPSVLFHDQLAPVYSLGARNAVVLSGAVGSGRLVAISDSSVLINNMLELDGNRAFAKNLVRYLAGQGNGTLYILGTDVDVVGVMFNAAHPWLGLNAALARVAALELPRSAVMALSVVLSFLLLSAAGSSLPRRSSYSRRMDAPECMAGFAGRVRRYAQRRDNFAAPLLTFKLEIEGFLRSRLRRQGSPHFDALAALRDAGGSQRTIDQTRALLAELEALQAPSQGEGPRIDERKFREIIATGRRILADIRTLPQFRA